MADTLNIAIAGLGTVGVGVFKLLTEKSGLLTQRCGKSLVIKAVSSRSKDKDRGISLSNVAWYDDPLTLVENNQIDVIVELIGGSEGVAYQLCEKALQQGKHVVTANKALIALHGEKLATIAEQNNVSLCFEASTAGGIPIIKAIKEGLAANEYYKITGIMNGTCNYILTEMKSTNRSFDDVLQEAQAKGYAETPPDLDIDGIDTAHKLAILTSLAYGVPVNFDHVYTEGIRDITLQDIECTEQFGYSIKLLGITQRTEQGIEQRVHPCLVSKNSPMAAINGAQNAVLVECDTLGPALFTGAGAGEGPTASSVVADLMDIASDCCRPPFGRSVSNMEQSNYCTIAQHTGAYYIRLNVKDQPGVLATITQQLADRNIGVEEVIQHAVPDENTAQIALTTHPISEQSINDALQHLAALDTVLEPPHMIRIEA